MAERASRGNQRRPPFIRPSLQGAMPMADQPRAPSGRSDARGLCRTCGALSFAQDECSNCAAATAARRHPFITTARRANGSATASRPSAARENEGGSAARPRANGSAARPRANGSATALRNAQAMKTDASETTAIRPGASLVAPSGSSAAQEPTPASTSSSEQAAPSSVPASASTVGTNQSSAGGKRQRQARDVIDLVSSDEESEDHNRREAKRARQIARMHQSNARLALRRVEPAQEDAPMATPESEDEDSRIRPRDPPQGRSFDSMPFNEGDFPTSAEVAHILRTRTTTSVANSSAPSVVSTTSSVPSAPPSRESTSSNTIAPTEPTTARVTTATTTRTTSSTTTTSAVSTPGSVETSSVNGAKASATGASGVSEQAEQRQEPVQAVRGSTSNTTASASLSLASPQVTESASSDVATAHAKPGTSRVTIATPTPSRPVVSVPGTSANGSAVEVSQSLSSEKASTTAATSHSVPPVDKQVVAATASLPVASEKTTPAMEPPLAASSLPTSSAVATSQSVITESTSTTVSAAERTPPATTGSIRPVASMESTPVVATAQPGASQTTHSAVLSSQPGTTVKTQSPVDNLIVLDDSEDESDLEEEGESGLMPYQSRRFQSTVFNPRDFVTANDGLNLARRSSTITQLPTSPVATDAGLNPSTAPPQSNPPPTNGTPSTTTGPTHEMPVPTTASTTQPNVLVARRKPPSNDPPQPAKDTEESTTPPATIKIELTAPQHSVAVRRIIKPTLGHCSRQFLDFMRECADDDDLDEDEDETARAKLLEVVDLTNLSDDSLDDDDEDDDYFEIIESAVPPSIAPSTTNGGVRSDASSAAGAGVPVSTQDSQVKLGGSGPTQPIVNGAAIKRTRAPRPKETCSICEEKAWIRALVQCPDCKKYYHKKCAREFGDETVCYMCDADGIIDDSELTEEQRNEHIDLLGAFRQSSESEHEDDGDDQDAEEKSDTAVVVDQALLSRTVATTKSSRRWSEFLNVSTAPMEESFHRVTNQIAQELLDEERKHKYSRGFVRKEEFEKDMTEVLDHYAGLQDREESRLREDRSRAPATDVLRLDGTAPVGVASNAPVGENASGHLPVPGGAPEPAARS